MRINQLQFRAGARKGDKPLEISPKRITVFIGPNNGGKSAALREITNYAHSANPSTGNIFDGISLTPPTDEEIDEKLVHIVDRTGTNGDHVNIGTAQTGQTSIDLSYFLNRLKSSRGTNDAYIFENFHRHFVLNLDGQNRLQLVGRVNSGGLRERPSTTLGRIFRNDDLRRTISKLVHSAFDRYLLVDATPMSSLQYVFGDELPSITLERSFGEEAIEFYSKCSPLESASDGTKAFVGILVEILAGWHDIFLIDEPEAFLHPSLAYLLGREITHHIADKRQLFVATHSSQFLMGCLSVGLEVEIVRLTYKGSVATARHVSQAALEPMMRDPLLKSIGVMNALFFEGAVVTESDGDRAFYQEINSRMETFRGEGIRHAEFLNAHGKPEVVKIARMLRNIGIPAAMVLDIDWIKEDGIVAARYFDAAGVPQGLRDGLLATRRNVRKSLEACKSPDAKDADYKTKGGIRLLQGAELATAKKFFSEMSEYGLFTQVNGELEQWLPELHVVAHKNLWLAAMFNRLGSNPNDDQYVKPGDGDVWDLIRSIRSWTLQREPQGMEFVPD
jgi:predicted ATPase